MAKRTRTAKERTQRKMANPRILAHNLPLAIFILFSLFLFYFYLPAIYKVGGGGKEGLGGEENKKDVFLVTMVVSEAKDAEHRQLIRNSWFKFKDNRYFFFLFFKYRKGNWLLLMN